MSCFASYFTTTDNKSVVSSLLCNILKIEKILKSS